MSYPKSVHCQHYVCFGINKHHGNSKAIHRTGGAISASALKEIIWSLGELRGMNILHETHFMEHAIYGRKTITTTFTKSIRLYLFTGRPFYGPKVLMGLPSCGGDVAVYVFDINQPSWPTPFFLFRSCVYFCLYGPFNCISFHKFSRQFSVLLLCSSGLISALLVLSTIYLFMKSSLSPDIILCG